MDQQKNYTVKKITDSKYEIDITISKDIFKKSYDSLLDEASKKVDIKGFRKGKVPKEVIEEQLKEQILIETFEKIAPTFTWVALSTEKLNVLIPVEYSNLPQLKLDEDIKYTVKVVTMPKFDICNIKDIKITKDSEEVKEDELNKTMDEMYKNNKGDSKSMDDKWATEIAGKYGIKGVTTLVKLKDEVKLLIEKQKKDIVEKEFQRNILRKAIEKSKLAVPQEAIDYEAHQREHSFMHQLEDAKMSLEDYLKNYSVKIEDMKKAWLEDSKQALEEHIFLAKYAEANEIKFDENEFMEFVKSTTGQTEVKYNKEWIESLRSLFFKQKSFDHLIKSVKTNLGITDEKKKDIVFAG